MTTPEDLLAGLSRDAVATLTEKATRIRRLAETAAQCAVEIGRELYHVRVIVGPRRFAPWLASVLCWPRSTAYNYIAVYLKHAKEDGSICPNVGQMGLSILQLLAQSSTTPEAAEQVQNAFLEAAQAGDKLTAQEAGQIIRMHAPLDQEDGAVPATAAGCAADETAAEEEADEPAPDPDEDLEPWQREKLHELEIAEQADDELRKALRHGQEMRRHLEQSGVVRKPIFAVLDSVLNRLGKLLARREANARPEYQHHRRGRAG